MLPARTAKSHERMVRRIVAFPYGYFSNGAGHSVIGQSKKSKQHLLARVTVLRMHFYKARLGGSGENRQVEGVQIEPAQEQVDIRDGQWSIRSITGRAGICAGALRPNKKKVPIKSTN